MGVLVEDLLTLARLDEVREAAARAARPRRARPRRRRRRARDRAGPRDQRWTPSPAAGDRRRRPAAPGARQPAAQRARAHAGGHADRGLRRPPATRCALSVRDHGPGLPTDDADALFERFWRAEGGRERGKGGAGPRPGDRRRDRRRARRPRVRGQRPGRRRGVHRAPARALNRGPRNVSGSAQPARSGGADAGDMSELAILPAPARRWPLAVAAPDVDIVVPVYNEEAGLERSIRRLHRFLRDGFPFSWRIVVADNASVDATPAIGAAAGARAAQRRLPAPGAQGPRPRAAGRLDGQPRARGRLHGRRSLHRPAGAAPAGRAAALRPQRPGDRHAAGARRRAWCAAPSAS